MRFKRSRPLSGIINHPRRKNALNRLKRGLSPVLSVGLYLGCKNMEK